MNANRITGDAFPALVRHKGTRASAGVIDIAQRISKPATQNLFVPEPAQERQGRGCVNFMRVIGGFTCFSGYPEKSRFAVSPCQIRIGQGGN